MNELIKLNEVNIGDESIQTVNARELHEFLESKQDFSTWIKNRINDYDFVENQDFAVSHKKMENPQGGRPAIEYQISLDMAKELSMVERNEKGKQARKYFIECEKKLREVTQPQPTQLIGEVEDKLRAIKFVLDCSNISPVAKETALITSAETLTGVSINYRPQLERKTYTATQIGEQLGISANKVGKLTNTHNLKTDKYGMRVLDKARGHSKQVETFRYYDNVIPVLKSILESEVSL